MIKIDLITGFLGSGKTTFLIKYVEYLIRQKVHVGVIENDFGAVNVDMMLLQDLEGEYCEIEPIVGGNVVSDWKRRCKAKLISLFMQGFERVVVEPSGIYDVDAFFEVLYEEPLSSKFEIGTIITIVDAKGLERLSEQAEYLFMSQVASSGKVILSKVGDTIPQQRQQTIADLERLLRKYECDRTIEMDVVAKEWATLTEEDYEELLQCGWRNASYKTMHFDENEVFMSLYFMQVELPKDDLQMRLQALIRDASCGDIFRIKGFCETKNGNWFEINMTKEDMQIKEIKKGQQVIIVIGEKLKEERILTYLTKEKDSGYTSIAF